MLLLIPPSGRVVLKMPYTHRPHRYTIMNARQLRQQFLDYFAAQAHTVVPSSTLVPPMDPSLLFTNSGMVQFKDIFLGRENPPYTRATSCQRSLRVGGKHNDLEMVGHTRRHLTLFEMLGNFSFGDYFKEQAIEYAWTFVTGELGLSRDRLWVTVHSHDQEAADIWRRIAGLSKDRILPIDTNDNFWQMGSTGPCGYCSEIFYDQGEHVPGSLPGTADQDGDRYTELWNLVFMEFSLHADGSRTALARQSVDTGMGLDRLESIVQDSGGIFGTESFMTLKEVLAATLGVSSATRAGCDKTETSLNVMADHIRAATLMIFDGVWPGNEGRGYVLRRLIRRAVRYGYQLDRGEPFLFEAVAHVADHFADSCTGIVGRADKIRTLVHLEEERFYNTLSNGMRVLTEQMATVSDRQLDGDFCFKLYDCYGFPLDLTRQAAGEHGFDVDSVGFEERMAEQRANARAACAFTADEMSFIPAGLSSEFIGYEHQVAQTQVTAIFQDGQPVEQLSSGEQAIVVLEHTPFYAESGGQVGDSGAIYSPTAQFMVCDTQKVCGAWLHIGHLDGAPLNVGDTVCAQIDTARRTQVVRNHSATHLMHQALVDVLGDHVRQSGSLVDERRTRFDFTHEKALQADEIRRIEDQVNQQILLNADTEVRLMDHQAAVNSGAKALFGEKYDDVVRVLNIGNSTELCGGTHVGRTGDIGLFKVTHQSGVGAGIRRIEATTGTNVLERVRWLENITSDLSQQLSQPRLDALSGQLRSLRDSQKSLLGQRARLSEQLFHLELDQIAGSASVVAGYSVMVAATSTQDMDTLRAGMDRLRNRCPGAVVVLASPDEKNEKVKMLVGLGREVKGKLSARELIRQLSPLVGGKGGGGRDDFAQAGGTRADMLTDMPAKARAVIGTALDASATAGA